MTSSTGGGLVLPTGYDPYVIMGIAGFTGSSNTQKYKYDLTIGTMSNSSYGLILAPSTSTVDTLKVSYFYL